MKDNSRSGGLSFCSVLTIVFIVLKLCDVIHWSWIWVLSPLWIPIILVILFEIPGIERDAEQERYIKLNKLERLMTPQKPEYEADGYDDEGRLCYDTAYCPNCQEKYEVGYDNPEHCKNCGQALDWSEEN